MGRLFVVATPIGNLEDITLRALRVLKEAELIAAEDTRHTKALLSHFGISKPLTSYHEHNEKEKTPELIEILKAGTDIALVTDAGTPGISDPGYRLIKAAVENSVEVVPVPGPSAIITALSASGLPIDEFTYKGFLPASKGKRRTHLLEMKSPGRTFVIYESPRRVAEALEDILDVLGDIDIIMARELTKIHEEFMRGKASAVLQALEGREIKGEVVLILRTNEEKAGGRSYVEELERLLKEGLPVKEASRAVAAEFDVPKGDVYKEAIVIKERLKQQ